MKTDAIRVEDLHKSYLRVNALTGVNLRLSWGSIRGLLGPNGAGKTTLVRMLTTWLKPDAGRALVEGNAVVRDAARLPPAIGLAGQYAAVAAPSEQTTRRRRIGPMANKIQIGAGVAAVVLVVLLLWPVFRAGEPWLIFVLIAFLAGTGLIAVLATRSHRRWPRYALLGVIPGFIIGGAGIWALVRYGGWGGSTGWEDLVAVAAGIMGAFFGAILGAVVGGLIGLRQDRKGT